MAWMSAACSGFMETGSRRSLGLRPMANSMGVLPLEDTCVFLTVVALRINLAGMICVRVVWSKFLKALSQEELLEQAYPSQLVLAMVYAVLLGFSSHCAFDYMPACHQVGGRPYTHKSPSGSSGKCASTHEAQ